jgi:Kef-type K+ transport system membrane component KefB
VGLAVAGFMLALLGVVLNDATVVWAAIALLATSAIIRLLGRKGVNQKSDGDGPV